MPVSPSEDLRSLYVALDLANAQLAFPDLALSEDHYKHSLWGDSIAKLRIFFECLLREVATAHNLRLKGVSLPDSICTSPANVREYLKRESLLTDQGRTLIAAVYGFASETGSHARLIKMTEAEQKAEADLVQSAIIGCSLYVLRRFSHFWNLDSSGPRPDGMLQADKIRNYVRDQFIAPAKNAGMTQIRVRSGDVHRALHLSNSYSAVCSAMRGVRIQELCNVGIATEEGNVGANFCVTYSLCEKEGPR